MSETISQTPYISKITDSDLFLFDSVEQPTGQWTSHCLGFDLATYVAARIGLPFVETGYPYYNGGSPTTYSATIPGNVLTSPLTAGITIPSPILTSPTINTAVTFGAGVTLPGNILSGPLASGLTIPSPTITGAATFAPGSVPTPQFNRLFLTLSEQDSIHVPRAFSSAAEVSDYYGSGSVQATLAADFFAGYTGSQAQALFARVPLASARGRLYGANLINMTLAELQAISGTLSITCNTGTASASINLSGVASFTAAATAIAAALNAALPTVGVFPGSSIAPYSAQFTASATGSVINVTAIASGPIYVGSAVPELSAFGQGDGGPFISSQISGTPGGIGVYSLSSPATAYVASETMHATCGILTIGTVSSGAPGEGLLLSGTSVTANSTIARNIAGSGAGSTWVTPYTQTVASETITGGMLPLTVTWNAPSGATFNKFDVEGLSNWPTDGNSTITYMSGTAAAALGLTQAAGAQLSTPGSAGPNIAAFMTGFVANNQTPFSTFQVCTDLDFYSGSGELTQQDQFIAWAESTGGQYTFLPHTTATSALGAWTNGVPASAVELISDASYSAVYSDRIIAYTALTAARIVSLPYAAEFPANTRLLVVDASGACSPTNTITLNPLGSDTINGAASAAIAAPYGFIEIENFYGGGWTVVSSSGIAAITSGSINNATIGLTTPLAGAFTTLSASAKASFAAATTSAASSNIPQGVAPTAPNNGDEWVTTSGKYLYANGMTRGGVQAIGQSHIPFVMVSSGTMGNNGALSAITAVAAIYAAAYVYLPAGAIASGSAAGWYYAVFSSTTAATVYNNTYSSGTPAIPASPTAFVTTGPGAFTQTAGSLITAYSLTVPGNTIGANGSVRISKMFTFNNSAGAKTIRDYYGGTEFSSNAPTTTTSGGLITGFANCGVTNIQAMLLSASGGGGVAATAPFFGAVDTTASQSLAVELELATATDTVTLNSALVELIPGVT